MKKNNKLNLKNKIKNKNSGITLIVLIVTIVVMLILAGVTINVSTDGGLFRQAQNAKKSAEKAQDIEKITKAIIYAKEKDKRGKLTIENLQKELSEANVFEEAETIIVKLNGTYYEVGENGKIEMLDATGEKTLTIICKDSTEKEISRKEYTILKSKYSVIPPEVEDYEPLEEKLEGEINESTQIELTYYKIFDDDTELVFTGLNSSGAVTTVESEIVSYMVGDGTGTSGNGLKEKNKQGILKIPTTYKGKKINAIGQSSFAATKNIRKIIISDDVVTIEDAAFDQCRSVIEMMIGKNIEKIGTNAFRHCSGLITVTLKLEKIMSFNFFSGCTNFIKLKVNEDNKTYKVEDDVLYSKDGTILYMVPNGITGELIIPKDVIEIYPLAIASKSLNKVVISDTVTTIRNQGFAASSALEEILIGKDVVDIEDNAFRACTALKTIVIDSSTVAGNITSQNVFGRLMNSATIIYIKSDIEIIGSYITDNFTIETSDKDGYIKYVKNS